MERIKRIGTFGVLGGAVILSACSTSIHMEKVEGPLPPYLPDEGIYAYLPKTSIEASFPVTLTAKWKSDLVFKDCQIACNKSPADTPEQCKYKMTLVERNITIGAPQISSHLERDPAHMYRVKIGGSALTKVRHKLLLTRDGVMSEGEAVAIDNTVDVVAKVVNAAAGVVKPSVLGVTAAVPKAAITRSEALTCADVAEIADGLMSLPGEINSLRQRIDKILATDGMSARPETLTAILSRYDNAISTKKTRLDGIKARLKPVTFEKEERVWKAVLPMDRPTQDLVALDPALLVQSGKIPASVAWDMEPSDAIRQINDNVETSDDRSCDTSGKKKLEVCYSISLDEEDRQHLCASETADQKLYCKDAPTEPKIGGYRYRIPMPSTVAIQVWTQEDKNNVPQKYVIRSEARLPVAQFGPIASLPSRLPGKGGQLSLKAYEDTGGLERVSFENEAVSVETASSFAQSAASYYGRREEKRAQEEQAKATAELDALEAENKLLEAKKKNQDLKRELEQAE